MADLELNRHDRVRLHAELARVFDSPPRIGAALDDIKFPAQHRPTPGGRVDDYWRVVLDSLEAGVLPDGYRTLLGRSLQIYPFNATFRQLAADYAPELVNGPGVKAGSSTEPGGRGRTGEQDQTECDCHVAIARDDEDEAVRALTDAGLAPEKIWSTAVGAFYR